MARKLKKTGRRLSSKAAHSNDIDRAQVFNNPIDLQGIRPLHSSTIALSLPANHHPLPRDVVKATSYIGDNLHRNISTVELAAVAGVAERTLRKHFRIFIGISPTAYSIQLRLLAARRALQFAEGTSSVTIVATEYGFSHLGRFSSLYRQAFGESPSSVVRRHAPAIKKDAASPVSPALKYGKPELTVLPFVVPGPLANIAEAIGCKIASTVKSDVAVSIGPKRDRTTGRYLLRGNIIQSGENICIAVALTDVESAAHLWGDSWDGSVGQILHLIDRVVRETARSILTKIRKTEFARVARKPLRDLQAHELCLRAYPLLAATTGPTAREALDLLYRASELDKDFALAPGLAAWGHAQLILQGNSISPKADLAKAQLLSARASSLDPDNTIVLTACGMVQTINGDNEAAAVLIERALSRNPFLPWAWERNGWQRLYSGDAKAAVACFGRSLRLQPETSKATRYIGIGAAFFDAGDYHLSARWMLRALQAEPAALWINRSLAVCYKFIGERALALRSVTALKQHSPDITVSEIVSSLRFAPDFKARIANGLYDLGLAP